MELVNKINEKDLYAARAVADQNGNNITGTYATKSEIPSVDGLMAEDKLTIEDGKITKYDGTPFAGQGGSGGSDETVLFDYVATGVGSVTLSEPMENFETLKILLGHSNGNDGMEYKFYPASPEKIHHLSYQCGGGYNEYWIAVYCSATSTTITCSNSKAIYGAYNSTAITGKGTTEEHKNCIHKVIGIGRKGGN